MGRLVMYSTSGTAFLLMWACLLHGCCLLLLLLLLLPWLVLAGTWHLVHILIFLISNCIAHRLARWLDLVVMQAWVWSFL